MANELKPLRIIPKEECVFRLDRHGVWHSYGEKFTNQRISRYFHSCIGKDKDGFYMEQEHPHYIERVYFPYEDTALFVSRIIKEDELTLCVNTGNRLKLDPTKLFVENDDLYIRDGQDRIKFTETALLALAEYMEDADGQYVITLDGQSHPIPQTE